MTSTTKQMRPNGRGGGYLLCIDTIWANKWRWWWRRGDAIPRSTFSLLLYVPARNWATET